MKRIVIISIIVALAAVTPHYFGMQIEDKMHDQVRLTNEQLAASPLINGTVELRDYQRGWLDSKALWAVKLEVMGKEGETHEVDFDVDVAVVHGPLLFDQEVQFGAALIKVDLYAQQLLTAIAQAAGEEIPAQWPSAVTEYPPIEERIRVDFAGVSHWTVEAAPVLVESKQDKGYFKWAGLSAKGTASEDLTHFTGQILSDGFSLLDEQQQVGVTMSDMTLDMDIQQFNSLLNTGSSRFHFGQLKISDGGEESLSISDVAFSTEANVNNGAVWQVLEMTARAITSPETPAFLQDLGFRHRIELDGMDAEGFEQVARGLQALSEEEGNEVAAAAFAQTLETLLTKSLAHEPGIKLELALQLPKGESADVSLQLNIVDLDPATAIADPMQALQYLLGSAEVKAPQQWVLDVINYTVAEGFAGLVEAEVMTQEEANKVALEQANGMLEAVLGQGFVVQEGQMLKTRAKLGKGLALSVNGTLVPLPPM